MKTTSFVRRTGVACVVALMFAGCGGWTSPDANVLRVESLGVPADGSRSYGLVEMPGVTRTVSPEDLSVGAAFAVRGNGGKILVKFVRILGTADTIGQAQISFDVVKGNTYYAGFTRRPAGKFNGCIGCSGTVSFPMTGSLSASTDSVHIDYVSGEPLCRGCVAMRPDSVRMVARRE